MVVQSQFIEMIGRVDSTPFNTCLIGEIATIKHGYPFDGHYFSEEDNGVMLVTPGNFKIGGGFQEIKCKYFTSSYPTEYVLNSGDLIVTMTDLSKQSDTLGFGAIVPTREGRVYLHNQRIGLFENVSPLVDKEYLCWCLRTSEYRSYILSSATGSIIKHTSPKRIQEARIIMPPLTIQKQFVSISRQADKSKFDGLKSQFIARFGTTEQCYYPVKTLREIALSSGEYGANTPATKYNPEKGRYIRITDIDEFGNLSDEMVSPEVVESKYLLHRGDLLFARTGATVGKTYLHKTGKALYAGYLIKYQFIDTVLPEFVFAYTHSKEYYQWVGLTQKVGAQPNISAKQYDGLRIVVPPFEEQKAFVGLMNQADKSKYLS